MGQRSGGVAGEIVNLFELECNLRRGALSGCSSDMPITQHYKNGTDDFLIFPRVPAYASSLMVQNGKLAGKQTDVGPYGNGFW